MAPRSHGLHPIAKTPIGKAVRRLYRLAQEPYDAQLVCLGCRCTEDNACRGGCHWVQPGICSRCAKRTAKILRDSRIASELVRDRYCAFRMIGLKSIPVMSLALVAWMRDEQMAKLHEERIAEGLVLRPFTRLRIGKTCWSFDLVYKPKPGDAGVTFTTSLRLTTGQRRKNTRRRWRT